MPSFVNNAITFPQAGIQVEKADQKQSGKFPVIDPYYLVF